MNEVQIESGKLKVESKEQPNPALLTAENLSIGYKRTKIAQGLNVHLLAGEVVCLLGVNGAGKTTFLRTLAGMQAPLAGTVRLNGQLLHDLPPHERARLLSVVLTERPDVGLLTAWELVALGRHPYTGWSSRLSEGDRAAVIWALQAAGAVDLARRLVNELSDGERQKVLIARALAQQPRLIILDEPTAFLDLPRRLEIMLLLRRLAREAGCAVLLSTHDLDLALRYADQVWLLRAGRLTVGAPEDLALAGAVTTAFAADSVTFDAAQGEFIPLGQSGREITLIDSGDAAAMLWTRRALERAGCVITPEALDHVSVVEAHGRRLWRLTNAGTAAEYDSLAGLVAALQNGG